MLSTPLVEHLCKILTCNVDNGPDQIEANAVRDHQLEVIIESVCVLVNLLIEITLEGAEIHWPLDDLRVIRSIFLGRRPRT